MHTLEEFMAEMRLDESLGRFFWLKSGRGRRPGLQVGAFDVHGYGQINFKRTIYKEHRLVWLFITGKWPDGQIDHVNHDRRDNRFCNLRVVDNQTNHTNRPMQSNNKSGYVGVHFNKRIKLFQSYINIHGKRKNLGWFKTADSAALARSDANEKYGFHENHGKGTGRPRHKKSQPKLTTCAPLDPPQSPA